MNILTAPFYALFSVDFYRRIIRSSLLTGFLYLLYLSFLGSVGLLVLIHFYAYPEVDKFVNWFKQDMPPLVWTPQEGLSMGIKSPYVMSYGEKLEPIVVFDMEKTSVSTEDMGDAPVFVTAKQIYVRSSGNQTRTFDVSNVTDPSLKDKGPVPITADNVDQFWRMLIPWMYIGGFFFSLIFIFIWKLFAALFYSWIGLLVNMSRQVKLDYSVLLNLSCFAITFSTLFQLMQMLIPGMNRIPYGWIGSVIVTTTYLFLAIKFTEENSAGTGDSSTALQ